MPKHPEPNKKLITYLKKITACPDCNSVKVAQGGVTLQYVVWDKKEKKLALVTTDVCRKDWQKLSEKPIEWTSKTDDPTTSTAQTEPTWVN